jgi:hypothetical protein
MPTIGWIDALRTYNAGMPSWCVPRKGTPGYERVMRIRQGEQTKGFKEVLEDLERKTSGKPKKEKKSMAIDLDTQSATLPTIPNGSPKTEVPVKKSSVSNNKKAMAVVPVNYVAEGGAKEEPKKESKVINRIPEIEAQVEKEIAEGSVSVQYPLGWRPDTTEEILSGGSRPHQDISLYQKLMGLKETPTMLDVKKLESHRVDGHLNADAINLAKRIRAWKPENVYYAKEINYNTKVRRFNRGRTSVDPEEVVKQVALDYQEFAEEVNKLRGTPIRNISLSTKYYPDGTHTLTAYWGIDRERKVKLGESYEVLTHKYYLREYEVEPTFKLIKAKSMLIEDVKKEIEMEGAEDKAKADKRAEKEKEKEADPRTPLKKRIQEIENQITDLTVRRNALKEKWTSKEWKDIEKQLDVLYKEKDGLNTQVGRITRQQAKARKAQATA